MVTRRAVPFVLWIQKSRDTEVILAGLLARLAVSEDLGNVAGAVENR